VCVTPFTVSTSRTRTFVAASSLAANFGFGFKGTSAECPAASLTLATAVSAIGALTRPRLPLPRCFGGLAEKACSLNLQPAGLAPFGQLTRTRRARVGSIGSTVATGGTTAGEVGPAGGTGTWSSKAPMSAPLPPGVTIGTPG